MPEFTNPRGFTPNQQRAIATQALLEHLLQGVVLTAEVARVRLNGEMGVQSDRYEVVLRERAIVPASAQDVPPLVT